MSAVQTNILGTRQDTWMVGLQVENPHDPGQFLEFGIWDTRSGGEIDSDERLYYPGGMLPPYSLGGRPTPNQMTIARNYRIGRDHMGTAGPPGVQTLIDAVGVSRVIVTVFPMDRFKNQSSRAIVWTGTLKTVNLPEHNSESASDPGMIELTITVDAKPTTFG